MKNKKLIITIFLLVLFIGLMILGINLLINKGGNELVEYTPQEEISEEQARQTLITLYFRNKETKMLMPEARMIDAKLLISNPYKQLVEMLIEGPKNESLEKTIPEGTKINSVELKGDIVYIDFSKEFIGDNVGGAEYESNIVYSIVNTLTELTEVRGVKIIIDGNENMCFKDEAIVFNEPFVKII